MAEAAKYLLSVVEKRDPHQPEFKQAVTEVVESLIPVFERHPEYVPVFERLLEPERVIQFQVPWVDDKGNPRCNRGFRVQYNSAIGPYKGGLRFHPSVNLSIIKFLGFEQIFKNSLTTLPMGGGKGGSDFDPKGKSDVEVMNFTKSFMRELYRHIGPNMDVPAGDIGVGKREIGFMFGQYKRITKNFECVLTGKGPEWGGSKIRPEATGYGAVYFGLNMLETRGLDYKGKKCVVSGSGNVAQYTCEKVLDLGGIPLTVSDSQGYCLIEGGITREILEQIMDLKNVKRGRLSEFPSMCNKAKYFKGKRPWEVPCDCAFPSATQNEIEEEDAKTLVKNGCMLVSEGANMPSTPAAVEVFQKGGVLFGPGKAANAGGVAVSGLEMSQNSMRFNWTREEVDNKLKQIMKDIHQSCVDACNEYEKKDDYVFGANVAGFQKVCIAMMDQGF